MNVPTRRGELRLKTSLLTLALLALPAIEARADLTVVADVTNGGQMGRFGGGPGGGGDAPQQAQGAKQTVTTYYKGRKARTEVKNGPVTIYDADAGKVFRLDPARKTYTVAALRDVLDGKDAFGGVFGGPGGGRFGGGGPGGFPGGGGPGGEGGFRRERGEGGGGGAEGGNAGGERQERRQRFGGGEGGQQQQGGNDPAEQARREQFRAQMQQQIAQFVNNISYATTLTMTENPERRTVAQVEAQRIDLKGEMKIQLPAGGFGGGRFGGGGPGGRAQNGNNRGGAPQAPATQLEGEVWVARGSAFSLLPDNGRLGLFPSTAILTGPGSGAIAKSLSDRMVKASALPVALTLRSKRSFPGRPGGPGGPGGGGGEAREMVQTTEMLVTSLSGAELPDTLFAVPADYTDATPQPGQAGRPAATRQR